MSRAMLHQTTLLDADAHWGVAPSATAPYILVQLYDGNDMARIVLTPHEARHLQVELQRAIARVAPPPPTELPDWVQDDDGA